MGANSYVKGWKTSPKTSDTFFSNRLCDTVSNSIEWLSTISTYLLVLKLSLDVIKRQDTDSAEDWRHHGSLHWNYFVRCFWVSSFEHFFCLIEWHKLESVHGTSSQHCHCSSGIESSHSFLGNNSAEGVEDTFIVSLLTLCNSWSVISLHSD